MTAFPLELYLLNSWDQCILLNLKLKCYKTPPDLNPPNLRMNIIWCFYFKIDVTFHWQTVDIQPSQQFHYSKMRLNINCQTEIIFYFPNSGINQLEGHFQDVSSHFWFNINNLHKFELQLFWILCTKDICERVSVYTLDRPARPPKPCKGKYETHEIKSGDS